MDVGKVYVFQPQRQYTLKEFREILYARDWLVNEFICGNRDPTNLMKLTECSREDYEKSPIVVQRHIDSCHDAMLKLIEIIRVVEMKRAEELLQKQIPGFKPIPDRGVLRPGEYAKEKPAKA